MLIRRKIWLLTAILIAVPSVSHAHLRNYIDTYGTETLDEGQFGFEFRNEYRVPDRINDYFHSETEAEIGVTPRYTVGAYGILNEGQGFTGIRVENRYRLAPIENWPVDTAVYVAYKDANGRKDNDAIESKVMMSKDIDQWNFTGNGIMNFVREFKSNGDDEWEVTPGLALGASVKTGSIITPSLELLVIENESRLTPGLNVALAPNVRLSAGLGFGLEHRADNIQVKSLVQVEF